VAKWAGLSAISSVISFGLVVIYEAFPGEEAESAFMPLHCYEARRQTTGKEFPVKEIIGGSQTCICLRCWIVHN
jgi:hypothetical protein